MLAGVFDDAVAARAATLPATVQLALFVLNVAAVTGTSFMVLRHVMRQRDRARVDLELERERGAMRRLANVADLHGESGFCACSPLREATLRAP